MTFEEPEDWDHWEDWDEDEYWDENDDQAPIIMREKQEPFKDPELKDAKLEAFT